MDSNISSDRRFALLIDADNVSARYIKSILDELSKYGTVTVKRIYGDWTLSLHAKWKDALLENSITPIQQFSYTQGKNSTDSAMIIDAMDLLYGGSLEGFCLVSSDSDFTRLASRLRESGLTVIGMGEKKTPTPFRRACDVFTTLELLGGGDKGNGAAMSKQDVEQAVVDIITENLNNGKATGLGEVGSRMLKRYPDFDVRSYGTNLLSKLLDEFTRVKIIKDHSNVTVELVETLPADDIAFADAAAPDEASADAHDAEATAADTQNQKRSRRRRSRKIASGKDAAAHETAAHEAKAAAAAEEPAEPAEPKAPPADEKAPERKRDGGTRKGKDKDAQKPAKPAAKQKRKQRERAAAQAEPAAQTPQQYIYELVRDAGASGIELARIVDGVRARFKDFKVRDLGFAQMRQYIASVGDFDMEKAGRTVNVKLAE